jgi:hypothetical protein
MKNSYEANIFEILVDSHRPTLFLFGQPGMGAHGRGGDSHGRRSQIKMASSVKDLDGTRRMPAALRREG